ncbi:MAG: argininosuccinate lyase [Ardenticatenales bacterium]
MLWGGRFDGAIDPSLHALNRSLPFDRRLWAEDIAGSRAWARGLAAAGVLDAQEAAALDAGLAAVGDEWARGTFVENEGDEDIHSAVERRLGELVGPVAGKLHTGRSRNDQVATDLRLWVMAACDRLVDATGGLAAALVDVAARHVDALMPGMTHLQPAQPITFGHWLLSHVWPLARDRDRLLRVRATSAILPLGAGALAGTAFAIDRAALAADLGFRGVAPNSVDAVADRDFAAEFLFAAALIGIHLSRLAESLILFANPAFGFVALDDAYATGSSLMPQKKNPDPLELARGKSGRLIGRLTGLLATLKALPSAYDKDLQEDKEPVFDAHDTLAALLPVLAGLIRTLRVDADRMAAALDPAMLATDLADHLVRRGVPFRTAHGLAGRAVRLAEATGLPLTELPPSALTDLDGAFEPGDVAALTWTSALDARSAEGGTAPAAVARQLEAARQVLATWSDTHQPTSDSPH